MADEKHEVVVTDINVHFWSMVFLLVKWAIAAILAMVILYVVAALVSMSLDAILGSVVALVDGANNVMPQPKTMLGEMLSASEGETVPRCGSNYVVALRLFAAKLHQKRRDMRFAGAPECTITHLAAGLNQVPKSIFNLERKELL